MANLLLSYNNFADDGTLSEVGSGNQWLSSLPLANLQNPLLSKVARTDSELVVDFDLDIGDRKTISFVALLKHNLTSAATWRVRISNVDTFATTVYDSGTIDIWSRTETLGSSPWGAFPWDGKATPEDGDFGFLIFDAVFGRYVRIDIVDSGNPDGYIQAGRLIVDSPFRPTVNPSYGLQIGYVNPSNKRRSRGGQPWVDRLPQYREMRIPFEAILESQAYGTLYEIDRQAGISGDVFVMLDPDDEINRHRQGFYGTIKNPTPISHDGPNSHSKSFVIEESL